jgi:hypothetical protein
MGCVEMRSGSEVMLCDWLLGDVSSAEQDNLWLWICCSTGGDA